MPVLDGKVAVVTGANRGIGRAIAVALAAAGASVAATARSVASLAETVAEIRSHGGTCLPVECDVTREESVAAMAEAAGRELGAASVVVASAGIAGPTKPMQDISMEEWRECVATDLDGVFLTFRAFLPSLMERRSGSLIALSSITGKRPLHGRTPYAAAKLGVIGLCRTLATELGPYGIRVNSICPGAVNGPRITEVIRNQARVRGISEEAVRRQFTEGAPLKRLVEPEEVAAACVFLASDASAAVTGEDVNVTAGAVMY